jgi:predicted TIM-barrel fold metal-dependent hydrolase
MSAVDCVVFRIVAREAPASFVFGDDAIGATAILKKINRRLFLLPFVLACATTRSAPLQTPIVDYHQHLVSPAFEPIVKLPARDAKALLSQLDAAGISKAVVLSVGYSFSDERKKLEDPDRLTREENDWTSSQVASSGGRLIGFCSANPLRPSALGELERCLGLPGMKGVKMHFGNSGVSLRVPDHAERMAQVFALAERARVPVLVHMRARGGSNYGAEDARLFLEKIVPAAPSIEIVVAHLGGAGPGYGAQTDSVMEVFGNAAERKDPRMRNIYFDVATSVTGEITTEEAAVVAKRIRQVGAAKVLYGSDLGPPGGSIRSGWEIFRTRVPLTPREFQTIAGNVTRFMR